MSLLVILPIALPGIVTALAFRTAFRTILGVELSLWTVAVSHATFCIVVVFNNVIARLRRMGTTPEEASMDLGADTFTTFRLVTLPLLRGALLAGALLAFGLSFDEIVVTLFTAPPGVTTLPIWIFENLFRPNQGPVVNVVAACLVAAVDLPDLPQPAAGGRQHHPRRPPLGTGAGLKAHGATADALAMSAGLSGTAEPATVPVDDGPADGARPRDASRRWTASAAWPSSWSWWVTRCPGSGCCRPPASRSSSPSPAT